MAIIQGDLAEYALPDLLQFMHATRKAGQLVLEDSSATAAGVFFDDHWLEEIVPERVPGDQAASTRAPPPTLLANLLVHKLDGQRSLRVILDDLQCTERELIDELHLLVRTGWVRFRDGETLYRRYLAG